MTVTSDKKKTDQKTLAIKADAEDNVIKEKLNALFWLRLLYNSGEELWKHIGKLG